MDTVHLLQLIERQTAFNFLLPKYKEPIFHHNEQSISEKTANIIGELFQYLVFDKNENREKVQHFLLQCVVTFFSEDFGILENSLFSQLILDCQNGQSSKILFGNLFQQMATIKPAQTGVFKNVPYFNGGLFKIVDPIELDKKGLDLLEKASKDNWKHIKPNIFGALFQSFLKKTERHKFSAHFTYEIDIFKIVTPTIIRPWKKRLDETKTLSGLKTMLKDISQFKVLDPACGCGDFLYIAYLSLKEIEMQIVEKMISKTSCKNKSFQSQISTKQFFGIDIQPIAVEIAKMTMMIAKEIACDLRM